MTTQPQSPLQKAMPPFLAKQTGIDQVVDAETAPARRPAHSNVTPLSLAEASRIVETNRNRWDGEDADGEPFDPTPHHVSLTDGARRYEFEGVRLSYVSSERPHKARWTDLTIYRTAGGRYLSHQVGVSAIVHVENCDVLTTYHRRYAAGVDAIAADELSPTSRTACDVCKPDYPALLHSDPASLLFERNRHSVALVTTAESLIESLYTRKSGEKTLGSLAASALQLAADRDPLLASYYYGNYAVG